MLECLLILACTEDGTTKQILIPTDRIFLTKNIPFFEAMFRESSNWIEGNDDMDDIKWDDQKVVKVQKADGNYLLAKKVLLPNPMQPETFAKYMKSLYDKNLDIDRFNCVDFYRVIDYFQDKRTLEVIIQFIKNNITFGNSIALMNMSNLFDDQVEAHYVRNAGEYLSDSSNLSTFLLTFRDASLNVFEKILLYLHKTDMESASSIFSKIIKNRINYFPETVESIIFRSSPIVRRFNLDEKFIMYNHCVNKIEEKIHSSTTNTLSNIYRHIYGEKHEVAKICYIKSMESNDKVTLFMKLCYDKRRENDRGNAEEIRLLQDDPEIIKFIDHRTDCKLSKLELVEACANGQIETVKALVDAGCDFNAREEAGEVIDNLPKFRPGSEPGYFYYGPLTIACYNGHLNVVEYLLSKEGLSLETYYAKNGTDPDKVQLDALHAACRRENNEKIIDRLLEKSVEWNGFSSVEDCNAEMVQYAKAKINK